MSVHITCIRAHELHWPYVQLSLITATWRGVRTHIAHWYATVNGLVLAAMLLWGHEHLHTCTTHTHQTHTHTHWVICSRVGSMPTKPVFGKQTQTHEPKHTRSLRTGLWFNVRASFYRERTRCRNIIMHWKMNRQGRATRPEIMFVMSYQTSNQVKWTTSVILGGGGGLKGVNVDRMGCSHFWAWSSVCPHKACTGDWSVRVALTVPGSLLHGSGFIKARADLFWEPRAASPLMSRTSVGVGGRRRSAGGRSNLVPSLVTHSLSSHKGGGEGSRNSGW